MRANILTIILAVMIIISGCLNDVDTANIQSQVLEPEEPVHVSETYPGRYWQGNTFTATQEYDVNILHIYGDIKTMECRILQEGDDPASLRVAVNDVNCV